MPDFSHALTMLGQTDTGLLRGHNEDAIFLDARDGLAVLADGMGGYNAGEVASALAVQSVVAFLRSAEAQHTGKAAEPPELINRLVAAVEHANLAVFAAASSNPAYRGMGTTLVVALWRESGLFVAHVGDSRLYRLRGETLNQITHDHSFLQEQIDLGLITEAEAEMSGHRNLITRAVGIGQNVEVEVHQHAVAVGDLYMLCSDGLSDDVPVATVVDVLTAMRTNLPMAAAYLIQEANNAGGKDNISVVLADIKRQLPGDGWRDMLPGWLHDFLHKDGQEPSA
ncbi:Stp1/IreP family PP2C-type Ser/Thr phosphatase [Silvimonas iriomotensis]|uniref:PPM-type phosphatase domain-containing protein n=1 Tax=Silvimonas iriomotensis TaxID=449662 RepID=A0ABQ2PBH4_9NEIS|nr:Stp1/IreP family PP2C-type Ser/Thr phosphatase [Silvimonas iriomotensis]GGP22611.1 hypothetical protein GCM10010970_26150 [Silvimonas iriomotensis]